jgi:hypothetical protein
MSTTAFLRFPAEADFTSLLPADFERVGDAGAPLPQGVDAISIIGTIEQGGQWDEQGNVLVAPTVIPGYHVNMLGTVPPAWLPYVITPPATPVRIFGGTS